MVNLDIETEHGVFFDFAIFAINVNWNIRQSLHNDDNIVTIVN